MAATGQVFDEARHFYTMRDYLLELDCEVPPLDGYTHTVLTELLDTHRLVDKLLGMQLIVESIAVTLFRSVAKARRRAGAVGADALLRARRGAPRRPGRALPAALLARPASLEAHAPQAGAAQDRHPHRLGHAPQEALLRGAGHRQQRRLPPRHAPAARGHGRHAHARGRRAARRAGRLGAARPRQRPAPSICSSRASAPTAAGAGSAPSSAWSTGWRAWAIARSGWLHERRCHERWLYTSVVAAGMFLVRMLMLALMSLLQLTVGGAEIRPAARDVELVRSFTYFLVEKVDNERHAQCSRVLVLIATLTVARPLAKRGRADAPTSPAHLRRRRADVASRRAAAAPRRSRRASAARAWTARSARPRSAAVGRRRRRRGTRSVGRRCRGEPTRRSLGATLLDELVAQRQMRKNAAEHRRLHRRRRAPPPHRQRHACELAVAVADKQGRNRLHVAADSRPRPRPRRAAWSRPASRWKLRARRRHASPGRCASRLPPRADPRASIASRCPSTLRSKTTVYSVNPLA